MISIKNITWLDEDSYEGEITLVDSQHKELVCFTQFLSVDDIKKNLGLLYAQVKSDIVESAEKEYSLVHLESFCYRVVGELLDSNRRIVRCFDYQFELDSYLPGDIEDGSWIEFEIWRVDI